MHNKTQKRNKKYSNIEIKCRNGRKTIRKVVIHKCKGYKSVCHYKKGRCTFKNKKALTREEIDKIHSGIFIPGLFASCCKKYN
jgi:hypothetical protein